MRRVTVERTASRGGLVQHDPEREQIRAVIELFSARLLGAHVADGAHEGPGFRLVHRAARSRASTGQAEVQQLDAVSRQHDVGGLEVAMHHAAPVRVGQAHPRCEAPARSPPSIGSRPRAEPRGQRLAFHNSIAMKG